MKLKELLKDIPVVAVVGSEDIEITGVNIDSRRIKEGHLFVAMKGTQVDGHKFVPKAVELGAKAVLCEDMPEQKAEGVTYVQVESTEDAVGKVATTFHGNPSTKLKLVGVTGTNGKTISLQREPLGERSHMPDVHGMGARDAVYLIESRGLKVKLQGRGKVVEQSIKPGSKIAKGMTCVLRLA